MPNTDLDTLRGAYDAFARRDLDAIKAALHPDFVMEQAAPLPWAGTRSGPEGFFAFLGSLLSHIDPVLEIEELYDAGDRIVQVGHTTGTVLASGRAFRVREVHVWQVRDGLLASFTVYIDAAAMRAALEGR